jgi:CRISPR/Cas system-associated exonuclease Cas4 (RecB family)
MTDDRFKVSWSSLQRWEQCRQKDYLVRQRMASPLKDVRNFLAGNIVDRIQRDWLDNPVPGVMHTWVDDYMERCIVESEQSGSIKWRNKNDKSEIKKFCVDVTKALEPILTARVLPYEYEPAVRFYSPVKIRKPSGEVVEIVLRGEFDLLIRDPADGRYSVWDLKTTKDNDYWKKTLGQLVFYDLVIISMYGQPPKETGLIQPACDEQIKKFTFDNSHRSEMWARISAMVESEWNNDHEPKKDNTGCNFCEVQHACKKFKRTLNVG